jgi:hypothetical protein
VLYRLDMGMAFDEAGHQEATLTVNHFIWVRSIGPITPPSTAT